MTEVFGKVMPAVGEVCVAAYEDGWYIGKVSLVRSAESREAQAELMKEIFTETVYLG